MNPFKNMISHHFEEVCKEQVLEPSYVTFKMKT